jgi:aspartate-semialdehyde dehydrogenase
MKKPVIAIVGATGAVGAEFVGCLTKRDFPVGTLKALASARSVGKTLEFRGDVIHVEELMERSFEGVDIALFSAGASVSRKFAPSAVKAGAVVVDNSSAFRMAGDVPLVIPESTKASSPIPIARRSRRSSPCGRSTRRIASSA